MLFKSILIPSSLRGGGLLYDLTNCVGGLDLKSQGHFHFPLLICAKQGEKLQIQNFPLVLLLIQLFTLSIDESGDSASVNMIFNGNRGNTDDLEASERPVKD